MQAIEWSVLFQLEPNHSWPQSRVVPACTESTAKKVVCGFGAVRDSNLTGLFGQCHYHKAKSPAVPNEAQNGTERERGRRLSPLESSSILVVAHSPYDNGFGWILASHCESVRLDRWTHSHTLWWWTLQNPGAVNRVGDNTKVETENTHTGTPRWNNRLNEALSQTDAVRVCVMTRHWRRLVATGENTKHSSATIHTQLGCVSAGWVGYFDSLGDFFWREYSRLLFLPLKIYINYRSK